MQDYSRVKLTDLVKDAILKLDNTTQVIASNFSGSLFPTNNLSVGMTFYNTDNNGFYICTAISDDGNATWVEIGNVSIKPGMDDKGQSISATYITKNELAVLNTNISKCALKSDLDGYAKINDLSKYALTANLSKYALLASPTFSGTVNAPTIKVSSLTVSNALTIPGGEIWLT